MREKFYGRLEQTRADDDVTRRAEEIALRGFTVICDCLTSSELAVWRKKIDEIYEQQEKELGHDTLALIHELDVCRAPILYDMDFIGLATHPKILAIVQQLLGDGYILNLQNATILRPGIEHHQTSWHRDLPYQSCIASQPLAINALLAIDEFSPETGGTQMVPFTHKAQVLPSDSYIKENRITVSAPAGSAILFDSMLLHRAGFNQSSVVRRSVNHLYTIPILKQQYDFARSLASRGPMLSPEVIQILGFTSQVPLDDKAWRLERLARLGIKV